VVPVLALVDKFVLGICRTDWHRTCPYLHLCLSMSLLVNIIKEIEPDRAVHIFNNQIIDLCVFLMVNLYLIGIIY